MDGYPLPIDELKGSKAVDVIDLSRKSLGVASGIIIAACLGSNMSLKTLKCRCLLAATGRNPALPIWRAAFQGAMGQLRFQA